MMRWLVVVLVALLVLLQIRLWFGEGSISNEIALDKQWHQQSEINESLMLRNRLIAQEVESLKTNLDSLEEKARKDLGMIKEGEELAALHDQIVVKVPMIKEGIKAIKYFASKGIRTNCTLIFSAGQALLAAKAGATYISPFLGRLDDVSTDGIQLIQQIRVIYDNYAFDTEILAASVRHPMHIIHCAEIGADVMTGPLSAIKALAKHPLTDLGLQQFLADYAKGNK